MIHILKTLVSSTSTKNKWNNFRKTSNQSCSKVKKFVVEKLATVIFCMVIPYPGP